MPRYAIFYGYLGTYLRGVPKIGVGKDYESVEGIMEAGLRRFPVSNEPKFHYCSRTDQGVHAIRTCGHVDLTHEKEGREVEPRFLHKGLNKFFKEAMRPVRVHEVRKVCDEFHARFCAASRTYVYRLAVLREEEAANAERDLKNLLPITEYDHCQLVLPPFDAEKASQVPRLFLGTKDFATFCKAASRKERERLEEQGVVKSTLRRVYECSLEPGSAFLVSPLQPRPLYDVWNFNVRASGFLYHMVRRMAGAVIAVGRGALQLADVQAMLDTADSRKWNSRATTASANGLFLVDVEYDPRSFETGLVPDKPWSQTRYVQPRPRNDEKEELQLANDDVSSVDSLRSCG